MFGIVHRWFARVRRGPPRLTEVDRHVIATMTEIGASVDEIAETFGYDRRQLETLVASDAVTARPERTIT